MSTLPDIDAIIAEIDDRGFCLVPNVIPPAKADEARHALHALLDAEITEQARQARTQRVGQIAVKHPVFLELMCHPFVLAVWKKMLGEDIMCATWSANTTYPGFDSIGWHSDYPYWSLQPPWPPGNFAGQTLWLLDDFTVENGATAAIPYSHKKGPPPPPDRRRQQLLWPPHRRLLRRPCQRLDGG